MIRECLGNKSIEKVFRFDAITSDKIQTRSMNFLHVVLPETIVRDQNYSGLCHRFSLRESMTQPTIILIEAKALRLGRNMNNVKA